MHAFKHLIDLTENEIRHAIGKDVDVRVDVIPEQNSRHLFLVTAKVMGLDEPIHTSVCGFAPAGIRNLNFK